jgi:hypothetical protein
MRRIPFPAIGPLAIVACLLFLFVRTGSFVRTRKMVLIR